MTSKLDKFNEIYKKFKDNGNAVIEKISDEVEMIILNGDVNDLYKYAEFININGGKFRDHPLLFTIKNKKLDMFRAILDDIYLSPDNFVYDTFLFILSNIDEENLEENKIFLKYIYLHRFGWALSENRYDLFPPNVRDACIKCKEMGLFGDKLSDIDILIHNNEYRD